MEIYKLKNLNNGDILLEKVILNDSEYIIINENNGNKLLKKIKNIKIDKIEDIKKYNFIKSDILLCSLNNKVITKLKYKSILDNIYNIINDGTKIIRDSKLKIKTTNKNDEGFYYLEDLGISIQGVNSNKSLLEIINQCVKNEITLIMKIKLNNKTNIDINF